MVIDSLFQKRSQNLLIYLQMYPPPPGLKKKSSKNEMLVFGLHSTSDDQPCDPSDKS